MNHGKGTTQLDTYRSIPDTPRPMDGKRFGGLYLLYNVLGYFDPLCQVPQVEVYEHAAHITVRCLAFLRRLEPQDLLPNAFDRHNARSADAYFFLASRRKWIVVEKLLHERRRIV